MIEDVLPIFFLLLGLAVGSFMNVLVLRFGFNERPNPRSECAQCGTAIYWYDLVPVLSFLILKGRCRSCGSRLNRQYPVVELLTGLLFVLVYATTPPTLDMWSLVRFISLLLFWSAALATAAYDIRHTLIPMPFVYGLAIAALVYRVVELIAFQDVFVVLDALSGAALLGGFFALITVVTAGRGMGLGDAYIAATVGILLGAIHGVEAIMLGVWSATIVYLFILLCAALRLPLMGQQVTMKTELPFAPWIFFGAALVMFTHLSPLDTAQQFFDILWHY